MKLFKILPVLNLMEIRRTVQPLMLDHRQKDGRADMVFTSNVLSLLQEEQLLVK